MNLAAKYKQLFEGKVRSNDAVLLKEAGPVFEPGPGETLQGDVQSLLDINDSNFENLSKDTDFMKSILKNYDDTYKRLYEYIQGTYGSKGIKQHLDKISKMGTIDSEGGNNEYSTSDDLPNFGISFEEGGPQGVAAKAKDAFAKEMSGDHGEDADKIINVYAARLLGAYILNQQCEFKEQILSEIDEAVGEGETDIDAKSSKRNALVQPLLTDWKDPEPKVIKDEIKSLAEKIYDDAVKDKYVEEVQKAIDGGGLVAEYSEEEGSIDKVIDSGKLKAEGVGLFDDVKKWLNDKWEQLKAKWKDLTDMDSDVMTFN